MDFTGGCQCGRIRFRAAEPRDRASVCYYRMCQKASGGPFMAFVRFPVDQVHWSRPPETFASSNQVERGFCSQCGTPLTYRHLANPYVSVTLNSLDDPEVVRPEMRFSPDTEVSWCATLSALPTRHMDPTTDPDFVNHQRSA